VEIDRTPDVGFGAEDVAAIDPLFVTHNDKGDVEGVKYERLKRRFRQCFQRAAERNRTTAPSDRASRGAPLPPGGQGKATTPQNEDKHARLTESETCWRKVKNPNYTQSLGREDLFSRGEKKPPQGRWAGCAIAVQDVARNDQIWTQWNRKMPEHLDLHQTEGSRVSGIRTMPAIRSLLQS